jgi:hypothetical protein
LCAHYNGIKRGSHTPVPTPADIIAKPSKYLVTAKEFIGMIHPKPTKIGFNAKQTLIGMLLEEGELPTALLQAESGLASGMEESMVGYERERARIRAQEATGESAPPPCDDGHSGDEQDHDAPMVRHKRRTMAEGEDHPESCNVLNVLKVVDTIAAMHTGNGEKEGGHQSERWLSDEYIMGPVKDSLYNLHHALDRHPGPTPTIFENVETGMAQIMDAHKQAINDAIR